MRKIINSFLLLVMMLMPFSAFAMLSMELTQGVSGAIPIAVVPFANASLASQNVSNIIAADLRNSGRFKVFGKNALEQFPVFSSIGHR
jgi:TolB protein